MRLALSLVAYIALAGCTVRSGGPLDAGTDAAAPQMDAGPSCSAVAEQYCAVVLNCCPLAADQTCPYFNTFDPELGCSNCKDDYVRLYGCPDGG